MTEVSVISVLANNYSIFHKTLMFLMRLAWNSRIRLPYLIMIGFMVFDIRLTLEVIIDVEVEETPDNSGINQDESGSETDTDYEEPLPMIQQ